MRLDGAPFVGLELAERRIHWSAEPRHEQLRITLTNDQVEMSWEARTPRRKRDSDNLVVPDLPEGRYTLRLEEPDGHVLATYRFAERIDR